MNNCKNCIHRHIVEDGRIVDDKTCDTCRIIHEGKDIWYSNWEGEEFCKDCIVRIEE